MTEEIRECYRLLEVEPGAPLDAVKRAYRELLKVWHPDRFPDDPNFQKKATEKTKALNGAYQKLTAYLAGNYTESRASGRAAQEEATRAREAAEAKQREEATRRAREATEAKTREEARLREQRRQAEEWAKQQQEARAHADRSGVPPRVPPRVPPVTGRSQTKQATQPNERSPWRRAQKTAGAAFGLGSFAGIASANKASVQTGFSFGGRMLFTLFFGLFCGLFFAAATYLVAALFYAVKGEPKGVVEPVGSKAEKKTRKLGWVGILTVIAVLYVIGVSKQGQSARNPPTQPGASSAGETKKLTPHAQAAAATGSDFFEKYPDLKPYRSVFEGITERLDASGYTGRSRDAVMEELAKAAREQLAGRPQPMLDGWLAGRPQSALEGKQTPEDEISSLKVSAEKGDSAAQSRLGYRYNTGQGVPLNYEEAFKWYSKAAKQGDAGAQNNLGVMYRNGEAVQRDDVEAFKWYLLSAAQGNTNAIISRDNLVGALVPQQESESSWRVALFKTRFKNAERPADIPALKRSAEQGDGKAQIALGWLYCSGSEVPQNYTEAVNWWRKAADQGFSSAQNSVGLMYYLGHGVPQSYDEAVKCFSKVAQQGHAMGQYNLGEAFESGQGVPRDDLAAYTWYSLAAQQAYSFAIIRRDNLSTRLTPEQIAEARRRVSSFKPANQASP